MTRRALREAVVAAARRMNTLGINQGTAGNVSARIPGGLLITPSGVPYDGMDPDDVVELAGDGSVSAARPGLLPSTEWRLHTAILRDRPDVDAVVHAHPPYATTLACLRREIPAFHYMVAVAGGSSIRCAAYATFGTQALADNALRALADRRGCLLAHHGLVACGPDPAGALALALEMEALAGQYWRALQIGEPEPLPEDEMKRVLQEFARYGPGRVSDD